MPASSVIMPASHIIPTWRISSTNHPKKITFINSGFGSLKKLNAFESRNDKDFYPNKNSKPAAYEPHTNGGSVSVRREVPRLKVY